MPSPRTYSKANAIAVLRRAKVDEAVINEVMAKLPDPIDLDRDGSVLIQYGLSRDQLLDRMGGGP